MAIGYSPLYLRNNQIHMEETTISIIISVIALLVSIFVFFNSKQKGDEEVPETNFTTRPLQLQAY